MNTDPELEKSLLHLLKQCKNCGSVKYLICLDTCGNKFVCRACLKYNTQHLLHEHLDIKLLYNTDRKFVEEQRINGMEGYISNLLHLIQSHQSRLKQIKEQITYLEKQAYKIQNYFIKQIQYEISCIENRIQSKIPILDSKKDMFKTILQDLIKYTQRLQHQQKSMVKTEFANKIFSYIDFFIKNKYDEQSDFQLLENLFSQYQFIDFEKEKFKLSQDFSHYQIQSQYLPQVLAPQYTLDKIKSINKILQEHPEFQYNKDLKRLTIKFSRAQEVINLKFLYKSNISILQIKDFKEFYFFKRNTSIEDNLKLNISNRIFYNNLREIYEIVMSKQLRLVKFNQSCQQTKFKQFKIHEIRFNMTLYQTYGIAKTKLCRYSNNVRTSILQMFQQ